MTVVTPVIRCQTICHIFLGYNPYKSHFEEAYFHILDIYLLYFFVKKSFTAQKDLRVEATVRH